MADPSTSEERNHQIEYDQVANNEELVLATMDFGYVATRRIGQIADSIERDAVRWGKAIWYCDTPSPSLLGWDILADHEDALQEMVEAIYSIVYSDG